MQALDTQYLILLFILIPAIAGGWLAANRGRNVILWTILCGLFPVFLFIVWYEKPKEEVPGKFRQCPSCRQFIRWKADTCKFCGAKINP